MTGDDLRAAGVAVRRLFDRVPDGAAAEVLARVVDVAGPAERGAHDCPTASR